MRYIIASILTLFISIQSIAKCSSNGIFVLSSGTALHKDGYIVMEFYSSSMTLIPELNKKYPVYLKSKTGKVNLLVVETLKGEFLVTQVVLKPATALTENETYELQIENLPKHERIWGKWNNALKRYDPNTFTTSSASVNTVSELAVTPTELKKTMVSYGCGPARWVYFKVVAASTGPQLAKAKVKSTPTGKTTEYIVSVESGEVKLGHGMCSGAFHFESGDNYEVSFSLLDHAGNNAGTTKTVSFTTPVTETNEE